MYTYTHLRVPIKCTYVFPCTYVSLYNCRCGEDGPAFGVDAAQMWSKLMQHAEGPIAFEEGYRRMMRKYDNDEPRKTYIQELHDDPNKAHFKKVYVFSNGTLVDVCESLFSATKTWACGHSRTSSSLIMAVVRIVSGCRELIIKSFLFHPADTVRTTANKTSCIPVKQMFKYLSTRLTKSAVRSMYTMVDRDSRKYGIDIGADGDTTVTRKPSGDVFVVNNDFQCFGVSRQCWKQLHKGMLCPHGVQAAVERFLLIVPLHTYMLYPGIRTCS